MKAVLERTVTMVMLVFSITCFAEGIDENTVEDIMAGIEQAILDKDVNGIARYLSDDVSITVTFSIGDQDQVAKLTKAEYVSALRETWAAYQNYVYEKTNVVIDIVNGSKAVVKSDVSESMTIHNQTISANSREEATVEMINGKPLFTRIVAHTTM